MNLFWPLAVLAAIVIAIMNAKNTSDAQKLREKIHKRVAPAISYEYKRFNRNQDRKTTIERRGDQITIETDLQTIEASQSELVLEVHSQIELYLFKLQVKVIPFDYKQLLDDSEFYHKFMGELTVTGHGLSSAILIAQLNKLLELDLSHELAARTYRLKVLSMKRSKNEKVISFYCISSDNQEFDMILDYDSKRIKTFIDLNWLRSNQIQLLV